MNLTEAPLPELFDIKEITGSRLEFWEFVDILRKKYPPLEWVPEARKLSLETSFPSESLTLLVQLAGQPVAVLTGNEYTEYRSRKIGFDVKYMIVDPEYQNRGIGSRLLNIIKSKTEYQSISLIPSPIGVISLSKSYRETKLIEFYVKRGFYSDDGSGQQMIWDRQT